VSKTMISHSLVFEPKFCENLKVCILPAHKQTHKHTKYILRNQTIQLNEA